MIQYEKIDTTNKIYDVSLPRGDTGELDMLISGYDLQSGYDKIEFKMGKDLSGTPSIEKTVSDFSDNNVIITLNPSDTKDLMPGVYFYVCKLITSTNMVDTFIEKSMFIVEEA